MTAGNSLVMAIWGEDGTGPMHAIHFGYPIGAFIGPLIARPFLSKNISSSTNESQTFSYWYGYADIRSEVDDNSNLEALYPIVFTVIVILALSYLPVQLCCSPKKTGGVGKASYSWKDVLFPSKWAQGDGKFGVKILIFVVCFYTFLKGAAKGIQDYIVTFAVDSDLGFTNQEAAVLNSAINAMGAVARAAGIVVSRYVSVRIMLFTEVHAQLVVSLLLVVFVNVNSRTGVYIFCCFYGFVRDPLWPSGYAWTDLYIILLTTVVGVIKVVTNSVDVFQITLQGYLYENWTINSIFYTTFIYSCLLCLLTYAMYYTTWGRPSRHSSIKEVVVNLEKKDSNEIDDGQDQGQINVAYIKTDSYNSSDFVSDITEQSYL